MSLTAIPARGGPTVPSGCQSFGTTETAVPQFSVDPYPSEIVQEKATCTPSRSLFVARWSQRRQIDRTLRNSKTAGLIGALPVTIYATRPPNSARSFPRSTVSQIG